MKKPNPWEPKPLLDDHPWSLFPNLGLPRFIEFAAIAVWVGVVGVVATLEGHSWLRVFPTAMLGAWAVHYICARLGGRSAIVGGAAPPIRPDSAFQARIAFDIMSVVVLGTAGYSLFSP
jgi:hypothetical protein